jgi:hypothetical protein
MFSEDGKSVFSDTISPETQEMSKVGDENFHGEPRSRRLVSKDELPSDDAER